MEQSDGSHSEPPDGEHRAALHETRRSVQHPGGTHPSLQESHDRARDRIYPAKSAVLGPHATRWAESTIESRGIPAARVLQGLLSLTKKYKTEEIDRACDTAWRSQAFNYRVIKRLLENQTAARQQTMQFMDDHPIIRSVSEYGDFVRSSLQGDRSDV